MRRLLLCLAAFLCTAYGLEASAIDVQGGYTSVALDTGTLSSAAGLTLTGVSDGIGEGTLPGSVAFPINPRMTTDGLFPTTFSYDPSDFLGTFSGTIEHKGSVFFEGDVEVGNFTIGFDAARVDSLGGDASGFFVESTVGVQAILFDVKAPSSLNATESSLEIGADLLVSPELAGFLQDNGLASSDLSGATVGSALIQAVPEPSSVVLTLVGGVLSCLAVLRRRLT